MGAQAGAGAARTHLPGVGGAQRTKVGDRHLRQGACQLRGGSLGFRGVVGRVQRRAGWVDGREFFQHGHGVARVALLTRSLKVS
jgi:hypothetical protein